MDELIERLERANATLLKLADWYADKSDYDNQWRLQAKAEGVRLALSYAREEVASALDIDDPRHDENVVRDVDPITFADTCCGKCVFGTCYVDQMTGA